MNNKIKIIITIVLSALIIGIGMFFIYSNKQTLGNKKSKEFIKAISYIKEEKYVDAYNVIKNGNEEEKDMIQTILLYKFTEQFDIATDVVEKVSDEAENITNYLTYTFLYSKDPIYQQNVDKIYEEEYKPLFDIKNKIPKNILFEDCSKYYDLYFEYLNLDYGLFSNYEYNILNNKDELLNKLTNTIPNKLEELTSEYEKISGLHPLSAVQEEYLILFDF